LGIDVFRLGEAFAALMVTYFASKIVSRTLGKAFKKTPQPENVEKLIIRVRSTWYTS